jgi:AcrR family transcriptional regulator
MPKIVDRDRYRKQLLAQSFELFAEIGYGNITMRQIADRLGVSTGTLYHYFPSKEAMFLQLVEEQTQQDIANFLDRSGSIPTDLRSRIKAIFNFVSENRDYFTKQSIVCLDYCRQYRHKELQSKSIFDRADREYIKVISNYLQIENSAISVMIINFINGLILSDIYQSDFNDWEIQADLFVDAIAKISELAPTT